MVDKKDKKKVKKGDYKEVKSSKSKKSDFKEEKKKHPSKDEHEVRRLYRSNDDKMVAGVCGGIGDYLNIDSIWIRLILVILIFMEGVGLLAYVILWILMPENPKHKNSERTIVEEKVHEVSQRISERKVEKNHSSNYIGGLFLIAIGGIFLFDEFLPQNIWDYAWPVVIIVIGVALIMRNKEEK